MARNQRAAKIRIKKVFAANRDRQRFVWLNRQRRFLFASRARALLADRLRKSPGKEAIRNSVFDLVRVGDGIEIIKSNDPSKVVDAGDAPIDHIRFDHMPEPNRSVAAAKISRQRRRPQIQLELAIPPHHVARSHQTRGRIYGI